MPYTQPREASRGRLLLYALALSVALHGVAIIGAPSVDRMVFAPEPPPLEVDLIAPLPPPRPSPQLEPQSARPQHSAKPALSKPLPKPVSSARLPQQSPASPAPSSAVVAAVDGAAESPPAATDTASAAIERSPEPPAVAYPEVAYPIASARLVFDLYYGESLTLVGEVVQTFEVDAGRYIATSTAEAVGFVGLFLGGRYVQRSEGRIGPRGLTPERYTVLDRGERKPERAVFDWSEGVLHFERKDRVREAPLDAGAQDPLSAVHQLHFLRPLEPGLLIDVATTRKVERMLFLNMGHQEVDTALGPSVSVHVKRQDVDGEVTEVWLDPQRYFMPVRVYNRNRNGHVLIQVLREAAFVPRTPETP